MPTDSFLIIKNKTKMKTAITKIMDIIEMEHNNGVEISQRVLWNMLNEAKDEEKQQIIDAHNKGQQYYNSGYNPTVSKQYYETTFKN